MRILHILDHGLPLQSGYTFRTRAILKAQEARGWTVAAVTGQRHGPAAAAVESVTAGFAGAGGDGGDAGDPGERRFVACGDEAGEQIGVGSHSTGTVRPS